MRNRHCIAFAVATAIVAIGLAGPAKAQSYGPGMMGDGWGYGGYGVFPMVLWAVILIAIVVGIVWLVRNVVGSGTQGATGAATPRSAGLAVLEERYARGEINREEYLQKKGDILG